MNILLTGASSGFGRLIVADLVKHGHRVAGTVRDPEGRNQQAAKELRDLGVITIDLDITDQDSVTQGVAAAEAALGKIDVLINNAGVGAHGLQENFSDVEFQKLFDVNVFGVQRMIRAVAPAMRTRGDGLILTVSSLLGRVVMPFFGPYNATKWAVEALTENYRVELSQFGVDVALVEPGGFPTGFFGNIMTPASPDRDDSYGDMAHAPAGALQQLQEFLASNPEQQPGLVAEAIVKLVEQAPGTRRFRTEVDRVGMGDAVKPMNDQLEQVTHGLFTNFGIDGLLSVNTSAHKAA
ncbi:MAG: SDR family oxidoreductase [Rhodospirillaceae bacterium]